MSEVLLPPSVPGWPAILMSGETGHVSWDAEEVSKALSRIRAETLWWPVPTVNASKPLVIALDRASLARACQRHSSREVLLAKSPSAVDTSRLKEVFAPASHPARLWAALAGLACDEAQANARALLAQANCVCPWTGKALSLAQAIEAQSFLRHAALARRGTFGLVAMSRWKRRCLAPFLTGPDGAPVPVRSVKEARRRNLKPVVWGRTKEPGQGLLQVEDGFLRSVGLGLRHTPPSSVVIDSAPLYFDATQRNGLVELAEQRQICPDLRARAARLRARVTALQLSKYNLPGTAPLPDPGGKEAVLVAGQVEQDASILYGAGPIRSNQALLEAARRRFPKAFLLYKPHPDVLTGLRRGHVPEDVVEKVADEVVIGANAETCLAWADRVATLTSLLGFEALLRGKQVTTFGHPFYAGWGLTDDVEQAERSRRLSLDDLTALVLILYPSYIDRGSNLPAPPEVIVDALARERSQEHRLDRRLLRTWRDLISYVLNKL